MTSPVQVRGHSPGITATTFWFDDPPSRQGRHAAYPEHHHHDHGGDPDKVDETVPVRVDLHPAAMRATSHTPSTPEDTRLGAMSGVAPAQTDRRCNENDSCVAAEETEPGPRCQQCGVGVHVSDGLPRVAG